MTYQAVRRTPRPGQPSSTRHLGLRRAGGYARLADAVPMLPPQRLAILGYDDAGIGPRERYLPGAPLSHADGKHVAADPLGAAAHPEDVAAALGLHRKTVYGWVKKYREGGRGALLARPVPGLPPQLGPLQMRKLWTLIVGTDPRQLQFDFALWTCGMVRELVRREFGVGLRAVSVGLPGCWPRWG